MGELPCKWGVDMEYIFQIKRILIAFNEEKEGNFGHVVIPLRGV